MILLREKGETFRWQPVSPTLVAFLQLHIDERGPLEDQPLLRYRNGRQAGRRRYGYLFDRLGKTLPWLGTQQVSAHWLRHTHPHLGRARLRLRRSPRLRRTRRNTQRRRHHCPLRQSHPRRSRRRPRRTHRRTTPTRRHRRRPDRSPAGSAHDRRGRRRVTPTVPDACPESACPAMSRHGRTMCCATKFPSRSP